MLKIIKYIFFSTLVILICTQLGQYEIEYGKLLKNPLDKFVFLEYRVPRVILAFFAGAGLSLCGLLYQSLFRNPLTTPFTLGVASFSSLGAVLFIAVGHWFNSSNFWGSSLFSLSCAFLWVWGLAWVLKRKSSLALEKILLVGICVNLITSSLVVLVQLFLTPGQNQKIIRWLLGGIEVSGFESLTILIPMTIFLFFWSRKNHEALDLLSMGEDIAITRGLDFIKFRNILIILSSILVAIIVAECGPISFVGIIIPQLARRLRYSLHQDLLTSSFFLGGIFLCICDTLVRSLSVDVYLPVGIVTSLLGTPFFIYILITKR